MTRLIGTWKLPPAHAGANPLRVPGVRIRSTPAGLSVQLERDTVAVPASTSAWTVEMKRGCQLWGSPSVKVLDLAFAYMTFGVPGDPQLYAIEQSAWPAFAAGTDALPLAWVDSHDALTPRLSFAAVVLAKTFAFLSGGSNQHVPTDAPTDTYFHQYMTDTSGLLAYPIPDGSNAALAYSGLTGIYENDSGNGIASSPAELGASHDRIAANGNNVTLITGDNGELWYTSPPDNSAASVQCSIAEPASFGSITTHHVLAVNYDPAAHCWRILYESINQSGATIVNRGVFVLKYDESAHGVINPASGSNWAIDRTLQAHSVTLPGRDNVFGNGTIQPGYGAFTELNVLDHLFLNADMTVTPAGGGTITVHAPATIDISGLLVASPGYTLSLDMYVTLGGVLQIGTTSGTDTLVAHLNITSSAGELPNNGFLTDNDPATPDGISSGLYWVFGVAPFPTFSYVPWYVPLSASTYQLNTTTRNIEGVDPGSGIGWNGPFGDSQFFPSGATGFVIPSGSGNSLGGGSYDTRGVPFRTDDIASTVITLPLGLEDSTYKYWTDVIVSAVSAPGYLGAYPTSDYRRITYQGPTVGGQSAVIAADWPDATGTGQNPPTTGGFTVSVAPTFTPFYYASGTFEGAWYGLGEDGATIGHEANNSSLPNAWQYYGPGGDNAITDPAFTVGDLSVGWLPYRQLRFGPGSSAPFLDAAGNIIDSSGALDAQAALAVCGDGSTGLYAIIGGDLKRRSGPFGTSWTLVAAGFSTETTALLLRLNSDGTIVLVEGTAGMVRVETWDGTSTTRSAYEAFDTDNTVYTGGHLLYTAFSAAAMTSGL